MPKLIFGPEMIDGIWTIDVVDEDGEAHSYTYADKWEAEKAWDRMSRDAVDSNHRELDK